MSPARLRWLAIGVMLLAISSCSWNGCSGDDNSTPGGGSSKDAHVVAVTPASASGQGKSGEAKTGEAKTVKGLVIAATPFVQPGAAAASADDNDAVSVSADADPDSGGAPLTVNFTAEIEGSAPGVTYRWDFGDESPTSSALHVQHTYKEPGDYVATFSVTGPPETGIDDEREINIEVTEEGFDFDIETDNDVGPAPLRVEFTARLDEDLPGPFYFQWDFGDGARDVSNPTTHVYRAQGEFTTTVTVTNSQGQRATRDVQVTVDAPEEPTPGEGE